MSEVNVQKTTGCNEIKINVKPVPVNPVVIENSYRGIDYNVLKNKPKIEGNELIGDKTAKELLGFDKTDMDATIAVAQGAEEVANASNAKATGAYEIATEAKQIAEGIDGKATQALANSTTALETATQAKQTADSYQGQITTLRNDVDDLGDQVDTIEGKIPAEATTANQLADKEFVTTITDELAADITALDADVQKINLIKWVDTLPATGETKYLYAVAREEVDKDGHKIAALYLWDGTEWRGAGAFSLNIDPDTLATKTELAGYLPLSSKAVANGVASLDNTAKIPENQLPDKKIILNNDVLLEDVSTLLGVKKTYHQKLDDSLYCADKRFSVTLENFTSAPSHLFDGNNDTYVSLPKGQTGSILIEGNHNLGGGYPYGYIYVLFFYGCGLRDISNITCRIYQNWPGHNVGWITLNAEEVQSQSYPDVSKLIGVVRFENEQYYGIEKIELTLANTEGSSLIEGTDLRVSSVCLFRRRANLDALPVMTKWGDDTKYGNLTIDKASLKITSPDGNHTGVINMNNDGSMHIDTGLYLPQKTTSLKGSPIYEKDKAVANGVASLDANTKVPSAQIPVATASSLGGVKPDGTTIIVKADGTASATGAGYTEGDGIKGDYCTTYGIIDAPNGILTNPSGMEVVLKQGVVLQLAGQDIKTTISGDMAHTITSTADCDLFYVSGTTSLMEVAQIVWSRIEPDNGQAGVLAWWNPDNKKWKFKSNDTGNVWAEAVATPVAHIHTNGTTITRIDHIGYRVLDDEVYALKSETNTALAGKANTDLSNVPANIDYVVEYKNPTDSDPTWYRKWKSGKLEQGGIVPAREGNITFLKPFANTNYTVIGNISLTYRRAGQGDGSGSVLFFPEATSFCYVTFAARNFGDIGTQNTSWRAEGKGAN